MTAANIWSWVSPGNGRCPVMDSYSSAPIDQMSLRASTLLDAEHLLGRHVGGRADQVSPLGQLRRRCARATARRRPARSRAPSPPAGARRRSARNTFDGLMSRWITPSRAPRRRPSQASAPQAKASLERDPPTLCSMTRSRSSPRGTRGPDRAGSPGPASRLPTSSSLPTCGVVEAHEHARLPRESFERPASCARHSGRSTLTAARCPSGSRASKTTPTRASPELAPDAPAPADHRRPGAIERRPDAAWRAPRVCRSRRSPSSREICRASRRRATRAVARSACAACDRPPRARRPPSPPRPPAGPRRRSGCAGPRSPAGCRRSADRACVSSTISGWWPTMQWPQNDRSRGDPTSSTPTRALNHW